MAKFIEPEEVSGLIKDGDTVACGGFGAYLSPDTLFKAVSKSYTDTGHPCNITSISGISPGDSDINSERGMNSLAKEGLIGTAIAAHYGSPPRLSLAVRKNQFAAFALPLGVLANLLRDITAKRPGTFTKIGLSTFCDPRIEGCKANERAAESEREIVQLINIGGENYLFFPAFNINVALIRASKSDTDGNLSMEKEAMLGPELLMAQAVHSCGGIVIAQAEEIVPSGSINPTKIVINKGLVDYVVKARPGEHLQSFASDEYHPELSGESKIPADEIEPMKMSIRKLIARRAVAEIREDKIINIGIGIPSGIGKVANEECIKALFSLESGTLGGIPVEGVGFGAAINPDSIGSLADTFDLYDGHFLDCTFLGMAEVDKEGNVNVAKFGSKYLGPGGFIDISQGTPTVYFMGSFTAGKSDIQIGGGRLEIKDDAPGIKFVDSVKQISFASEFAKRHKLNVFYITERAVFKLIDKQLMLIEIAPGVDLERDILAHMQFRPLISDQLRLMDERIFKTEAMRLNKK